MALDLFTIVKHITEPNGNPELMQTDEAKKAYAPFMVNRALAQSTSTVLFAQEMNKGIVTDKEMHYAFLFHSVKKTKRYSKWSKKAPIPDKIELIQKAYEISIEKALEIEPLIGAAEELILKQWLDTGGVQGRQKSTKED